MVTVFVILCAAGYGCWGLAREEGGEDSAQLRWACIWVLPDAV